LTSVPSTSKITTVAIARPPVGVVVPEVEQEAFRLHEDESYGCRGGPDALFTARPFVGRLQFDW